MPQNGQTPVSAVNACSIGLMRPAAPAALVRSMDPVTPAEEDAVEPVEGDGAFATGLAAESLPVRSPEPVSGLPQSMQKREFGSFSRPQKVQVLGELTRGRGRACEGEYTGNSAAGARFRVELRQPVASSG